MRVALALPDAQRVAQRLRSAGVEVVFAAGPRAAALVAADAAASGHDLTRADVLLVSGDRDSLTSDLVTMCDRSGTRIVARCRRDLDRRFAESLGVATVDADADPVDALHATPALPGPLTRGRAIVVWGPHGAPGRTTVSIELAYTLARGDRRVALADADTHAPSVALALGVPDEGPGLAAACRQAARGVLTPAELTRIAVPVEDVEVLTGINRPNRWPELSADRVTGALEAERDWVDDLVVDVAAGLERDEEIVSDLDGPRRNAAALAALATADLVVGVVAADPVGVSRFVRAYPELRAAAGDAPIRVLVTKLRGGPLGIDARGQVRRTLERYTGADRSWFLPWEPRATDAALLAARPLARLAPRGPLPAAMRRFVDEAVAPDPARRRGRSARTAVAASAP
ncbi:P-loop NTPase [Microbacterium thalli]|uniref:P-loop NTPase n=1 Tax=Microbacterium thalli TaxID=3027921 RepID=UPI0023650060|nr:P-loop NTPase [Microbacterium thalli]MDD7930421.1 hypothetical protein [Microbacterium thalli]